MLKQILCVRDSVADVFFTPFFASSLSVGQRDFVKGCQDGLAEHPKDLVLYHLGDMDDVSGLMRAIDPVRVMNGFEALQEEK